MMLEFDKGDVCMSQKIIHTKFEHKEIPSGDVVIEKQLFNFLDELKNTLDNTMLYDS